MSKLTKVFSMGLTTMIGVTALVGCGSSEKVDNSTTVTVDFWSAPNQGQYNYWEEKANAFNATNTQINGKTIQVKVQQMPETPSSEAGIQNALATGTVPAISENINRGFATTLAASDVVYELQDEEWFKDIIEEKKIEETLKGWEINDKQFVLPTYVNPMTWQWNVKALEALGISEVPTTVAEFDAVLEAFVANQDKMKEIGVTHTFYRPSIVRPDQWWDRWHDFQMPYMALTQKLDWVDGNKLVLDREGAIEAFEFIGKFGNTIQTGEMSNIWLEDMPQVLVTINAPWDINILRESGKVYGTDYIYGPSIVKNEGDTPYNYADAKGLVLYKHNSISEDEHAGAVEFVKWIYNKENSAQTDLDWLKTTKMLPVRGDIVENPVFSDTLGEYPELKDLAEQVPFSVPCMPHDKMTDIQTALTEKGMVPYIELVKQSEPLNVPEADAYIDAAFEAMRQAGGLE